MKSVTRGLLFTLCAASLIMGGCVSSGTYQAKEQESLQLSRNLEETKGALTELQETNRKISAERDTVALKLEKMAGEAGELKLTGEKLKLENERIRLENEKLAIAARPENMLRTLGESIAALQAENARLKLSLEAAARAVPPKDAVPVPKADPVVIRPVAAVEAVSPDRVKSGGEPPVQAAPMKEFLPEAASRMKNEETLQQTPLPGLPKEPTAEQK